MIQQFRKNKPTHTSRYYNSASAGQGNFYPLDYSATKRLRQDPDEVLLDSIDMTPIRTPQAVRVKKEIIVQSLPVDENSSRDTREEF